MLQSIIHCTGKRLRQFRRYIQYPAALVSERFYLYSVFRRHQYRPLVASGDIFFSISMMIRKRPALYPGAKLRQLVEEPGRIANACHRDAGTPLQPVTSIPDLSDEQMTYTRRLQGHGIRPGMVRNTGPRDAVDHNQIHL